MSVGLMLINTSKAEKVTFDKLPVSTAYEICSNNAASKIVVRYMIDNMGDEIRFVPDQPDDPRWPKSIDFADISKYTEVSERILNQLESDHCLSGRVKVNPIETEVQTFFWKFE